MWVEGRSWKTWKKTNGSDYKQHSEDPCEDSAKR